MPTEAIAGGELGVNESADTFECLFRPVKGTYFSFSDGCRSCLGRRFAPSVSFYERPVRRREVWELESKHKDMASIESLFRLLALRQALTSRLWLTLSPVCLLSLVRGRSYLVVRFLVGSHPSC